MCNVKYILSPWPVVTDAFVSEGSIGQVFLYRNPTVLPRAYLVGRYRWARTPDEAMAILLADGMDPSTDVILYDRPEGLPGTQLTDTRAAVDSYRTNEVIVKTFAETSCLLVLSDTFYPGWRAEVDGKDVPILKGNLNHRVVQLPPGDHVVRFIFHSASVALGLWLTGGGLILVVIALVVFKKGT